MVLRITITSIKLSPAISLKQSTLYAREVVAPDNDTKLEHGQPKHQADPVRTVSSTNTPKDETGCCNDARGHKNPKPLFWLADPMIPPC